MQRVPSLLLAIKRAVDRKRQRGRFLLTGSAHLALLDKVSESLAGRASYLSLWPMTRREQRGRGRCGVWQASASDSSRIKRSSRATSPCPRPPCTAGVEPGVLAAPWWAVL
jgi:hypothetical protein